MTADVWPEQELLLTRAEEMGWSGGEIRRGADTGEVQAGGKSKGRKAPCCFEHLCESRVRQREV